MSGRGFFVLFKPFLNFIEKFFTYYCGNAALFSSNFL